MKLVKGQNYRVSEMECIGWDRDGQPVDGRGRNVGHYLAVDDTRYLGPDVDGVEPVFAAVLANAALATAE